MATDEYLKRKIRTVNINIDLYKKLYLLKIEKDSESLSTLVEELYELYIKKRKGSKT